MPTRPVSGSPLILLWLPPIAWAGALFALSAGSGPAFAPPIANIDKLEHAGAYALLGFLVARAASGSFDLGFAGVLLTGGLFCALYGASDEFHQSYTPGRQVEVADAVADTVGGFAGAAVFASMARRREAARG